MFKGEKEGKNKRYSKKFIYIKKYLFKNSGEKIIFSIYTKTK